MLLAEVCKEDKSITLCPSLQPKPLKAFFGHIRDQKASRWNHVQGEVD